uniref:histidine phosphotransferase family protein n=1 Tax=Sphingomonas segetis TaxID=1104779 RepID=UPI001EF037D9
DGYIVLYTNPRGSTSYGEEFANQIELAVRAEGPRILLDPVLRETLETGGRGMIEPRAAGAWLAHSLAAEGAASIRLSDPSSDVLMIGATLP